MRVWAWVVASVLVSLHASTAAAHPAVDAVAERLRQADIAGAREAIDAAEEASDLTRADLVVLLEQSAVVHHALSETELMEQALRRLALLEPSHVFSETVPPSVRERFASIERPPTGARLVVAARIVPTGVVIDAALAGPDHGLARGIVVSTRVADGPFVDHDGPRVELDAAPGTRIAYYVTVVGLGGAPVFTEGTREAPTTVVAGPERAPLTAPAPPAERRAILDERRPTSTDDESGTWGWWVAGGVLLAGAVAIAVVLLVVDADPSGTQLGGVEVDLP